MENNQPVSTAQTTPLAPAPGEISVTAAQKPPEKKNYTPYFIIGGVLLFILALAVIAAIGVSMIMSPTKNVSVSPTPTTPTPAPVVSTPTTSKFATDSAVLQIKSDLLKQMSDTDSVDLIEPQISPPNLDLSISVKSQ